MSAKEFKQLLDQVATPNSNSEPQWAAITGIVELVKQKDVNPRKASQDIRKKLLEASESTVLNTLYLVDSIVKNTSAAIHKDFLSSELLGALKAIVEGQGPSMAKAVDKVLEMLGEWKAAFGDDSSYKIVQTTFNDIEKGGYFIPEATLASASYMQKPPSFEEADKCYLCLKEFGKSFIKGRHHCRNCGKSICSKCTGDTTVPLPLFGIKEPQRVCITCHKKLDNPSDQSDSSNLPPEYLQLLGGGDTTSTSHTPQPSSTTVTSGTGDSGKELQLQEEEDLQMALAMSLNEEENKKKTSSSSTGTTGNKTTPTSFPVVTQAPPPVTQPVYTPIYADLDFQSHGVSQQSIPQQQNTDNELERYLNYGKQKKQETKTETNKSNNYVSPLCGTLCNLIDRFNQRMHDLNNKNIGIGTDQAVLTIHQDLTAMNIQLLQQMDETQEKKAHMESILHKLQEAKEARVTLDTMRRRHQEQLLQQEREQASLAQMQVQMKLALLRQQKAEQLAYGHSMQAERLGRLTNQREEYERSIASQREQERNQLIAQEEHVYSQQFGTQEEHVYNQQFGNQEEHVYQFGTTGQYTSPGPLPQKIDPPPYQPIPGLYQPTLYQPPESIEYHTPSVMQSSHTPSVMQSSHGHPNIPIGHTHSNIPIGHTHSNIPTGHIPSGPPIDQGQHYVPPPPNYSMGTAPPQTVPLSYSGAPPHQMTTHQMPLMTGMHSVTPPSLLQRPPSEPPLISFD